MSPPGWASPGMAKTGRAAAGIFIAQFVLGARLGLRGLPARTAVAVTLLRLWLAATAIVLAGMAVWAFAPVLVFMALLLVLSASPPPP